MKEDEEERGKRENRGEHESGKGMKRSGKIVKKRQKERQKTGRKRGRCINI